MAQIVQLRLIDENNCALSDFDLAWECYPRKKARLDAMKAWRQVEENRPSIEKIIAAIESQIRSGEWKEIQYVPYFATWLRRGQWDDE